MANQPLPEHPDEQLLARLEALLFVAPGSVTAAQLAVALELPIRQIEKSLDLLEDHLPQCFSHPRDPSATPPESLSTDHSPEMATDVENFLGLEITGRLSRAALETLAIIAYQQPVTRPEIDAIRGVNSDGVLKSLLSKGLIQEIGRAERPGRPILYSSTSEFLQNFGLNSLTELPPLIGESNDQAESLISRPTAT